LNAELEQRIYQRTIELEEALQSRDEFLSIAAHELKTPITNLRGFTGLSLRSVNKGETPTAADIQHTLEVIDQQAVKLTRFIAQLFDISRLQLGRMNLDKQATDMSKLIHDIVSNLQRTNSQHTITLHADPCLAVLVDPLRFEQVITNLLDNAIKYSPGGGAITVELMLSSPDTLQIVCTDNGIGIPVERRAHLFERFYRAHTQQQIVGMGLGLYISREIIELHDGTLTAEFPETGGTRFIISLPYGSSLIPEDTGHLVNSSSSQTK
jgi:two-component system, OmpR family, phosphate regulon sensor histidine kinase PhoR